MVGEPFQGLNAFVWFDTQGCRKLQPWADISERLRRIQTEPALK